MPPNIKKTKRRRSRHRQKIEIVKRELLGGGRIVADKDIYATLFESGLVHVGGMSNLMAQADVPTGFCYQYKTGNSTNTT